MRLLPVLVYCRSMHEHSYATRRLQNSRKSAVTPRRLSAISSSLRPQDLMMRVTVWYTWLSTGRPSYSFISICTMSSSVHSALLKSTTPLREQSYNIIQNWELLCFNIRLAFDQQQTLQHHRQPYLLGPSLKPP